MSLLAQSIARCWAPVACVAAAAVFSVGAHAATFTENFGAGVLPAGWTTVNNSVPIGLNTVGWSTGGAPPFAAQDGSAGGYAFANYNAVAGAATISDWFYTPSLTVSPTSVLSFWSRTVDAPAYPDRLEVRWSSAATPSAGTGSAAVGTFTTVLLTINPTLTTTGYPNAWTNYTYTFSSLAVPTTGNIAFRYFVTNGGPSGANSDFIGIDTVSVTDVTTAVPEPGTAAIFALGLGALALRRRLGR